MVDNPAAACRHVDELTDPIVISGRSHRGFNPASKTGMKLFCAALDRNYLMCGFRNADIREALFGPNENAPERRRQSPAEGRVFKRLHARGLIAKFPHTRRWLVSRKGQQLLGAMVQLYYHGIPALARPTA